METILNGKERFWWRRSYVSSSTNLERRVKHHQLGARGHNVVALVGFHKAHVNITLRFSSCEQEKMRKILSEEEISQQGK